MRFYLILVGIAGVLIGLGFVCPQLANIRDSGSLEATQILFFLIGIVISVGGAAGVAIGSRRMIAR
jgi:hypothetical protein